jgi:hypothetical protein
MADTLKELFDGELTALGATLYTVPASTTIIITEIIVANKTGADVVATIAVGNTKIVPAKPIPANDSLVIKTHTNLTSGKTIVGSAGADTSIDCHISGIEVV